MLFQGDLRSQAQVAFFVLSRLAQGAVQGALKAVSLGSALVDSALQLGFLLPEPLLGFQLRVQSVFGVSHGCFELGELFLAPRQLRSQSVSLLPCVVECLAEFSQLRIVRFQLSTQALCLHNLAAHLFLRIPCAVDV
eukprot:scaffold3787_cov258-Pinguiococcus_pyrenoidosus.AAC.5